MGEWFETWFNTDYYHALYNKRNEQEAANFIDRLVNILDIKPGTKVLDLACGGGRHSSQLHQLGFNVTGIDLSANSIDLAKSNYSKEIEFKVGDMRYLDKSASYDYIFNLFTSFGYFETMEENELVLSGIKNSMEPDGTVVIDFMNAKKVLGGLVPSETQIRGELIFNIKRLCDGSHFFKDIAVVDGEKASLFQEKVQYIDESDFRLMLNKTGFEIQKIYGSYELEDFDDKQSDRLIIVAKRSA